MCFQCLDSASAPVAHAIANPVSSYNRYLAVAARAVRRSLKDGPRLQAERRDRMDLKFAKWEVRIMPAVFYVVSEERIED